MPLLKTEEVAAYCNMRRSFFNKNHVRGDGPPFLRVGGAIR